MGPPTTVVCHGVGTSASLLSSWVMFGASRMAFVLPLSGRGVSLMLSGTSSPWAYLVHSFALFGSLVWASYGSSIGAKRLVGSYSVDPMQGFYLSLRVFLMCGASSCAR